MTTKPRDESSTDAPASFECLHFLEDLRVDMSSAEALSSSAAGLLPELVYIPKTRDESELADERDEYMRKVFGRLHALVLLTAEAMDKALTYLNQGIERAYEQRRRTGPATSGSRPTSTSKGSGNKGPGEDGSGNR